MKNKINRVITLANGKKYFVLKQAIYKGDNYYMVAEVTEDGNDLKEKFAMLHEEELTVNDLAISEDGKELIEFVKDPKTMQVLLDHLNLD